MPKKKPNTETIEQILARAQFADRKELESIYRKLAKQADQRLVRLRQLAEKDPDYKDITEYAYKRAMRDISGMFGESADRFNRSLKYKNVNQIKGAINDVSRFLQSETSTKRGLDKGLKARAKTLNDKLGTNFTWQEWKRYFDWQKENPRFEYVNETKMQATAHIYKTEQAGKEEIKKVMNNLIIEGNRGVVRQLELDLLKKRHPVLWRQVMSEIEAEGK